MTAYRVWSTMLDDLDVMASAAYELRERAESDLAKIVDRNPVGFVKHRVLSEQIPRNYRLPSGEEIRINHVVLGHDAEWTRIES